MFLPGLGGGDWADLSRHPGCEVFGQFDDIQNFHKAVTAGYGTDVASLTGGGALRLQSIEATLLATIQQASDMVLWNALEKSAATATVDEYSIKNRIGGFLGSAYAGELDEINEEQGNYERRTLEMKYVMTMRQVSAVQDSQRALVSSRAIEDVDATLELLSAIEWGCFFGDASCNDREFDGIRKQLTALGGDYVLDLRGGTITGLGQEISDSARLVKQYGNFGQLSDAYMSLAMQSDLDQKLEPNVRKQLGGGFANQTKIGTPVPGMVTSFGSIDFHPDIFVQEGGAPFIARGGGPAANVARGDVTVVTSVGVASAPTSGSQFLAAHAGLYYYAAEGGSRKGRSDVVKSGQVGVAAGDGVTVTITHGSSNATHFWLHRSRLDGSDDSGDFREMVRIPRSGGATTVYVDKNQNIPGTSTIFLLTMGQGRNAITFRRLRPLSRFELFPTNKAVYPWAVIFFGALRVGKPTNHRILINCQPGVGSGTIPGTSTPWRAFN